MLPARLPAMLVNGASGIAVGMATNIPPHNVSELADATIHLIDNPDAAVEELMQFIPGPDFPTGGLILGVEGIREAYATGRGRVVMRAKAYIEESRAGRYSIIVTELPFQVNKATLHEKIAELISDDKLPGASLVRDESDRNGMRLVVELKRDAQPKKVLNLLFKYTTMQSTFGVNMVALVNGNEPRVLGLKKSLQYHIEWRYEVITRRTRYDLKKAQERAHILEGLKIALDNLDTVISTIRASRTTESAKHNLRTTFKLSDVQAQAILDMRLARLAALERKKIEDEYIGVLKEITYLEDLLASPRKMYGLIKTDLQELKTKYGDARRTRIVETAAGEFSDEDLIPDLQVLVTITDRGYVKRLPHDTYKRQNRGGKGIIGMVTREMDAVQHLITCNTLDSLLFLTNRGKVYQLKAFRCPRRRPHRRRRDAPAHAGGRYGGGCRLYLGRSRRCGRSRSNSRVPFRYRLAVHRHPDAGQHGWLEARTRRAAALAADQDHLGVRAAEAFEHRHSRRTAGFSESRWKPRK